VIGNGQQAIGSRHQGIRLQAADCQLPFYRNLSEAAIEAYFSREAVMEAVG
jgi:hypothetical protein